MKRPLVITGGGRGIGAAIALQAARQGFPTALLYRADQASAQAVCAQAASHGPRSIAIQADVADEADILRAFDAVRAALGPVGGLVNNAGTNAGRMTIDRFDAQALERVFRVNVIGTLLCTREAVRHMALSQGGKGGVIVNISSMAASIGGRPGLSHYAASKSAVDAFTVGAARELAKEAIRVYAIRPGATETDWTAEGFRDPATRSAIERSIAMGRYAQPDEIAIPVMALFTDPFAFLSGAVIDASGGGYVLA
ncbi:MAG: SDR family NAD(P)-dependent oxidoreductase [Rhodoferax sp.]|nr:SDR family NAD(P)-dependent oxidoreductase [Rhodoferax sp.]